MKNQFIPLAEKYGNELADRYISDKLTLKELEKIYGVKSYIIGRALTYLGVELRNNSEVTILNNEKYDNMGRTYSVNKDYFKLWSSDMAYILGFITADGNVFRKSYTNESGKVKESNLLTIGLNVIDENHLIKIKDKLEYTGKIYHRKIKSNYKNEINYHESAILSITSKDMISDLISLGIVNDKSLVLKLPDIPEAFIIDFIRGYFDGDGSIGVQYPTNKFKVKTKTSQIRVRICSGSYEFLDSIQLILSNYGLKPKNITSAKNRNLHEICYSTKESLKIYELFYDNKDSMRLERKYIKFKEAIDTRNAEILINK